MYRSTIVILLIGSFIVAMIPGQAVCEESAEGYFILAGLCAAGALGCYKFYEWEKHRCDNKESGEESVYSDEDCEAFEMWAYIGLGAAIGLGLGAISCFIEGMEISSKKKHGLLDITKGRKLAFHSPHIYYNPVTGNKHIKLLTMDF